MPQHDGSLASSDSIVIGPVRQSHGLLRRQRWNALTTPDGYLSTCVIFDARDGRIGACVQKSRIRYCLVRGFAEVDCFDHVCQVQPFGFLQR